MATDKEWGKHPARCECKVCVDVRLQQGLDRFGNVAGSVEAAIVVLRDLSPVVRSHDVECECADCAQHHAAAALVYADIADVAVLE